ncbi:MAG: InlB B-repeat-containing protein, partial [Bacteroidales bacterium]
MKQFNYLFLLIFSFILFSCSSEDKESLYPSEMYGDYVVLRLGIDGYTVNSGGSKLKQSSESSGEISQVLRLTEDVSMLVTLEVDAPAQGDSTSSRASSTPGLENDSQILAIVYDKSNDKLFKCQTFTAGSPKISLPVDKSYGIVFYTYNTSTAPDITKMLSKGSISADPASGDAFFSFDAQLQDVEESFGHSVMWTVIENTGSISAISQLPNLLFVPVFTRFQLVLNAESDQFTALNAEIENTYEKAAVNIPELIKSWKDPYNIWQPIGSSASYKVPLNFSSLGSSSVSSDKVFFIVDEKNSTQFSISGIRLTTKSGEVEGTSQKLDYGILKRGHSYRVVGKILSNYGVSFVAESNGTVTPSGLQTAENGKMISSTATPNENYFLVGWFEGDTSTPVSATSGDVFVSNNGLTLNVKSSLEVNTKTYTAKFATYTVNFVSEDTNKGTVSLPGIQSGLPGTSFSSTATANEGHTFAGWYDEKNTKVETEATITRTLSSDETGKTYTAKFTANKYTVKFLAMTDGSTSTTGGTVSKTSASANFGTYIESIASVKTNYTFDGWYSSGSSTPISAIS